METGHGVSAASGRSGTFERGAEQISEGALHALVNSLPAYLYSVHYQDGAAAGTIHSRQCEKITGYTSSEHLRDHGLRFTA